MKYLFIFLILVICVRCNKPIPNKYTPSLFLNQAESDSILVDVVSIVEKTEGSFDESNSDGIGFHTVYIDRKYYESRSRRYIFDSYHIDNKLNRGYFYVYSKRPQIIGVGYEAYGGYIDFNEKDSIHIMYYTPHVSDFDELIEVGRKYFEDMINQKELEIYDTESLSIELDYKMPE